MKKGILCILMVFAMSIGNHAQIPIGGGGIGTIDPGGSNGCSIPHAIVLHGGSGANFMTIRIGASLSSSGNIVYLRRILKSTSCNYPTIHFTVNSESDPCHGTFVSNFNLNYSMNCNGLNYFGGVQGYTFHGTFSGANCPC